MWPGWLVLLLSGQTCQSRGGGGLTLAHKYIQRVTLDLGSLVMHVGSVAC